MLELDILPSDRRKHIIEYPAEQRPDETVSTSDQRRYQ